MASLHDINYKQYQQAVAEMMRANRIQAGKYRFTQPTADATGEQSPFNSALHAMIYRWFDADMAADELYSAAAFQVADGDDAGMIPRTTFTRSKDGKWGDPAHTPSDGFMLLAYAAVQVYHLTGDMNILERLYPRVSAWHAWFERRQLPRKTPTGKLVPITTTFHAARAGDLDAVAHIAYDLGLSADQAVWERRAQAAQTVVLHQLEREQDDLETALVTLFSEAVPPEQAARLAERLQAYFKTTALPVAQSSSNSISVALNWLMYNGLRRMGFNPLATELATRVVYLVERAGFYQFYHADSGDGLGSSSYPAAGLALDMLARERQGKPPRETCPQD